MRSSREHRRGAVVAAGMLWALTGCSTGVAGAPATAAGGTPFRAVDSTVTSEAAGPSTAGAASVNPVQAVMRKVDPCALHSVGAAAAATGMVPDSIMPTTSLAACDLDLKSGPGQPQVWTLTTTVGIGFDDGRRQQAAEERIGGIRFFRVPEPPGTGADKSCRHVMAFGSDTGIELRVRAVDLDAPPKPPCQIAAAYLAEVARYWKNPATRADKVTSPVLRAGDLDPCAGLDTLADALGGPVRTRASAPYSCSAVPAKPGAAAGSAGVVNTEVGVGTDPRPLVNPKNQNFRAIEVAGRPGVARELPSAKGATCSLTVIADESAALQDDQSRTDGRMSYQVLTVRAGDCDLAVRAANGVLAALR
ncbi:DUF3558 family protein [Actinokineospora cianjurensis]|uniref:Uncharacterized protein DUF3558 n=1 Tax=Actinokineospora cianjurensis TaxID=585224 RepID=A0A421B1R1_9PSEU|nr:DUF3558 family protein [Actinokineospora cianjurensis]RLK58359.1 uncharacterized protein DUF3558 [Actinokineospora cianjurensis]